MTMPPTTAPTTDAEGASPRARPSRGWWSNLERRHLFVLPLLVFLSALAFFPLYTLLRMSVSAVTAATLNLDWEFIGLDNFVLGFQGGHTQAALWRTLIFVVVVTSVGMIGGLAAAISLRTTGWWSAAILAIMVFAWALPPVVNGSAWKFLVADAGLLNDIARGVGITDRALPFLYDGSWALGTVALVNSWAVIPFNALVYRAALLNIDGEVFEAAAIDGATRWQEIRHIMVPSVKATTLVLLVLTIVFAFRSFDYIYVMTYGGPGTATNTLPFLAYLQAFSRFNFGLGAATSVITVLIVLLMAAVYARGIRREEAH